MNHRDGVPQRKPNSLYYSIAISCFHAKIFPREGALGLFSVFHCPFFIVRFSLSVVRLAAAPGRAVSLCLCGEAVLLPRRIRAYRQAQTPAGSGPPCLLTRQMSPRLTVPLVGS